LLIDRKQLKELIPVIAAQRKFRPAIVEKDYYLTVILNNIESLLTDKIVFKGGTLLNKIHLNYHRLSEDLDFTYRSTGGLETRSQRSRAIGPIRDRMPEFLQVLGAAPVDFPASTLCCGSYQILANPDAAMDVSAMILEGAVKAGAEALVLSCPLCDYNLGKKQSELLAKNKISTEVPVFYFTQLLALALGLDKDACRFDLTEKVGTELLKAKNYPGCEALYAA